MANQMTTSSTTTNTGSNESSRSESPDTTQYVSTVTPKLDLFYLHVLGTLPIQSHRPAADPKSGEKLQLLRKCYTAYIQISDTIFVILITFILLIVIVVLRRLG